MDTLKEALAPLLFVLSGLAAMLAPMASSGGRHDSAASTPFPGWPQAYEDRPLTALPLSDREENFARDFPGRVGRFSDGQREIIVRWIDQPTRRLHPASDCFRGIGYAIAPMPLKRDREGTAMGCFRATRANDVMTVCEVIRDTNDQSWPDASSWYWHAMTGKSQGPWWSLVVAEKGSQIHPE